MSSSNSELSNETAIETLFSRLDLEVKSKPAVQLSSYQYEPLRSEHHIRLLTFTHPLRIGNGDKWGVEYDKIDLFELDDCTFEIVQVDLREKPVYNCLSYVWGDPSTTTALRLKDNTSLNVTKNLSEAILKLVACGKVVPVWIDQLCINQRDLQERSSQVSMMGRIYMGAFNTNVWLGEAKEDCTKYFIYLFKKLRMLPKQEQTKAGRKAWLTDNVDLSFDPKNPTQKGKCFRAVEEILNRPWFMRAWVFQEVVLSKTIIIFIAKWTFIIEELFEIVQTIQNLQYNVNGYLGSLAKTAKGWEPLDNMEQLIRKRHRSTRNWLRFVWRAGGYWEATDKRDMVYAFLGLLNKENLYDPLPFIIKPDYASPVRQVYIDLARTVIEGCKDLTILCQVIGDEPHIGPEHMRLDEELPSWVPDWAISCPNVMPFHKAPDDNAFNACKDYICSPIFPSDDPETLIVRGRILTKIIRVINHNFEAGYFMNPDRKWLNLDWQHDQLNENFNTHQDLSSSSEQQQDNHTITRKRLLKLLVADGIQSRYITRTPENTPSLGDRRITELLHAYDTWPLIAADDTASNPNLEKVKDDLDDLQQMSLIVQRKRVAMLANGLLALVPRICVFMDDAPFDFEIAILHGSKTPVVIYENEPSRYKVIGQCYVEGWMYGDAVTWKEEDGDVITII